MHCRTFPAPAPDANPETSPLATTTAPTLPPITAPKWTDLLETERQVLLPLAPVWDEMPTTRHSTDAQRATASAVQPIDRKTLLPLRPVALAKPAAYGGA
jgi:hypothetical protein